MKLAFRNMGLPAAAIAEGVNSALRERGAVVVTAPPGAGKSTLLPLTILDALSNEGGMAKIMMMEPRRLAARQIAERMAWMCGEPVGKSVGYRMRFESKVSSSTRIEVVTEGVLVKMLLEDPALEGVDAVIFDEFHERSLTCDVALAMVREARSLLRPDLKMAIMSATIDAGEICRALDAPLVESRGRSYPVEISYAKEDVTPANCPEEVARAVSLAHRTQEGDMLAFLPGEAEIRRCAALLQDRLEGTDVFPLYGLLSSEEQRRAIAPSVPGRRKVVLATPVAETSITIEGVSIVIDSGLCKKPVWDPKSGLSHLETVRISADMAGQRAGRAGRTAPGSCFRLWTPATQARLAESRTPEILEADLASTVLDVAAWGGRARDLPWLTPPPASAVASAETLLGNLGALKSGGITRHGKALAAFPCHPRIAQMLLSATTPAARALAADVAAVIEEKDIQPDAGVDILQRVNALRRNRSRYTRVAKVAEQYGRLASAGEDNSPADALLAGKLIADAWPEWIAKALPQGCGHFRTATGEDVSMDMDDPLAGQEWVAVASLSSRPGTEGRIFLCAPLDPSGMGELTDRVQWSASEGRIVARRERRIGALTVDAKPLSDIPRETIVELICEAAAKDGLSMFDFAAPDVQNLQRRVCAVAAWHPELELPDLSTPAVLARASEWLPAVIGKASTSSELKKVDLPCTLWSLLSYAQQQSVDKLAPTHMEVPTGSRILLEYRQGAQAPVLRVRLQECFGLLDSPRVDGGRLPVLMELLSPGYKPVQLTSDLRSFWENTYFDVRKELRMRYPKHSWPEDPLSATPIRGALHRKK